MNRIYIYVLIIVYLSERTNFFDWYANKPIRFSSPKKRNFYLVFFSWEFKGIAPSNSI